MANLSCTDWEGEWGRRPRRVVRVPQVLRRKHNDIIWGWSENWRSKCSPRKNAEIGLVLSRVPLVKFKWIFSYRRLDPTVHSNRKPTEVFTTVVDGLLGGVLVQRHSQGSLHPRHACVVHVRTAQRSATCCILHGLSTVHCRSYLGALSSRSQRAEM